MRTNNFCIIAILFLAALFIAGCGERREVIEIKGSNTMLQLGQAWAEDYMSKSDANLTVSGEGSGVGIAAMINGTTDIAQSSREINAEEIERAKAKGVNPVQFIVAWDGLAIIVNPKNPVKKLTMDQLRSIYLGNIKNWKAVGGPDEEIVLHTRDTASGTHQYFKEHILRKGDSKGKEEFPRTAIVDTSSQAAVQSVAQDIGGIAYVGLGYINTKVAPVAIAESEGEGYVLPSVEAVMDRTYPISRPLYFNTNGEPTGKIKSYVDYVLSDDGQRVVMREDFVPVRKVEAK